jgi:hypothetical protein
MRLLFRFSAICIEELLQAIAILACYLTSFRVYFRDSIKPMSVSYTIFYNFPYVFTLMEGVFIW